MNIVFTGVCLAGALALPGTVHARPLVLNAQLQNYGGNGAYLAFYLTDAKGNYKKTLWVAGKKSKYYKHLSEWARGSGLSAGQFDGITGASVGSGKALTVTVELADTLVDAGYEIRVDSAVEDGRDYPLAVRIPLTAAGAGKPVQGRGYVKSFSYGL